MAGRHLRDLIAAYGERDDLKFRRAAQEIILEEESKRHTALARELRLVLTGTGAFVAGSEPDLPEPPSDRDSSLPLAKVSHSDRMLSDLVLNASTKLQVQRLLNEVRHWSELDQAGVPRRNTVLLSGPPGTGKTSVAKAIAHELGRPLVTARVEGLISSFLGETGANLQRLFEFIGRGTYVLFLDEFDSLGKMRDDPSDHGELRRVVNSVLQQIDDFAGSSIIVAATNHSQVLDAALWRRFDAVIEMPLPSHAEIQLLLGRHLGEAAVNFDAAVEALSGMPQAAVEYLANSARRHAIIEGRDQLRDIDVEIALDETRSRPWL